MHPSTSDLSELPSIGQLRRRMQEMAAIESVFAVEYGESQFEFHPKWDRDEQMGAIKNGSGDELFAHFTNPGCCILGFAHESEMSPYRTDPPKLWPGLLTSVPDDLRPSIEEPAFDVDSTTFVVWRLATKNRWQTDEIEYSDDEYGDGSSDLLSPLIASADEFAQWLEEYFEVDVDSAIVADVFEHKPLSKSQLKLLNPDASLADLRAAVKETGYPLK